MILNLSLFYQKIGNFNDEYKKKYKKSFLDYELAKAKAADENDERLDNLNTHLTKQKKHLRESVHHPKLDEMLEACFKILDDIEKGINTSVMISFNISYVIIKNSENFMIQMSH